MNWEFAFEPVLPTGALIAAAIAALLLLGYAAWRGQRGVVVRTLAFAALLGAMLNPTVSEIDREDLPGIVAVIVDESLSQSIAKRSDIVSAVRAELANMLGRFKSLEVRWGGVDANDAASNGTALFAALNRVMSDVPPDRTAGAILITDGLVHDVPARAAALGMSAPVHVLVTGPRGERDRRIIPERAPQFELVNNSVPLTFRVEDLSEGSGVVGNSTRVKVTVSRDGILVSTLTARLGETISVPVEITHAGENIVELEAEPLAGELTTVNNRTVFSIQGVRENLRVLLVSGEPNAGERAWRNLLKSDAAVDLVHFTILRPPDKMDATPINQLSLIAFPVRELFSTKIDEFDLIILDRYVNRRDIFPPQYFDNIARRIRDGGALLVVAGPDYASPGSVFRTPLSPVLPAEPTGRVVEFPYRATVTDLGKRHPVTRKLSGGGTSPPTWGRWFRTIEALPDRGYTLMSGAEDMPLLVLSEEEKGRVALLLSDQSWLWSRSFEGGGPQVALMRRLSHWLMKEPDLEHERLSGHAQAGKLIVQRQTMKDTAPDVRVTSPAGSAQIVTLKNTEPGIWTAEIEAREPGLYRLEDGEYTVLANVGLLNPKELVNLISTDQVLAPLVREMGGGMARIEKADNVSLPRITFLSETRQWAGASWFALKKTDAYLVRGIRTVPLVGGLLGLSLLLAVLAATWFREGR